MFTEAEITTLINERKPLSRSFDEMVRLKTKPGHKEYEVDIVGGQGSEFRLILRQSVVNPLDFSIILAHRILKSNQLFRLRRYNGKSHEHTNHLERNTFYGFHMHFATERYQDTPWREDAYAELTDRYGNFDEALNCMLSDCGFENPSGAAPQQGLFQ
jgi:hypothetical protein